MADKVVILKSLRDNVLLQHSLGKKFINYYYKVSPPIADFIGEHEALRTVVRWSLLPVVGVSWLALKIGLGFTFVLLISLLILANTATIVLLKKSN